MMVLSLSCCGGGGGDMVSLPSLFWWHGWYCPNRALLLLLLSCSGGGGGDTVSVLLSMCPSQYIMHGVGHCHCIIVAQHSCL